MNCVSGWYVSDFVNLSVHKTRAIFSSSETSLLIPVTNCVNPLLQALTESTVWECLLILTAFSPSCGSHIFLGSQVVGVSLDGNPIFFSTEASDAVLHISGT